MRGTVVGTSSALATACVVLSQGGNSVRSNRSKKRPNELRSRPAATYQGVSRVMSGSERQAALRHGQGVQTPTPRPWLMMDFVLPSTCVEIKFRAAHAIDESFCA